MVMFKIGYPHFKHVTDIHFLSSFVTNIDVGSTNLAHCILKMGLSFECRPWVNWRFLMEYFYWNILERFLYSCQKNKVKHITKRYKIVAGTNSFQSPGETIWWNGFTHKSTLFRSHSWLVNSNQQFHIFLRGISLYFY